MLKHIGYRRYKFGHNNEDGSSNASETIIIILHYSEDWIITDFSDEQRYMEMIKCNSLTKWYKL